jgi:YegS/Rv2252/BmrU family lipid kinase
MMKRVIFILNPASGTQNKELIISQIDDIINKEKYQSEIVWTSYAGHAVEIAQKAAEEGVYAVIAVGGDGTVNEIGRSLIHTDTIMGIVPSGSGNGLARHLQIPMEPKKALEVINESLVETIDYGLINKVPFFCTCGVGFDAFVSLKFAKAGKRGLLTYLEKTLQESLTYQPKLMTGNGRRDGETQGLLNSVWQRSQYGNNAYITPQATLTDGLLDVTILEPFTVLDVPSLAYQLFNKTIDQNSRIKTFRCKKLKISRSKSGVAHFDGDPMMTDHVVNIEIITNGLKVFVPREKEVKEGLNVLQKAQEYVNGLKQLNDSIFEDITAKNRTLLNKNKELLKKLTKRD